VLHAGGRGVTLHVAFAPVAAAYAAGIALALLGHTHHRPDEQEPSMSADLPTPRLRRMFRIDAALGTPVDLGAGPEGRRRIVPIAGGHFSGPELRGAVLPDGSADWQVVHEDGSSDGDIRLTLRTDAGAMLTLQSRGLRHGPPEVLARLARGEPVAASEYTFRTATRIDTTAPGLEWLNAGIFVATGGRQPDGVAYDVYLVE
jgi:hypothetical protein